MTQMPEKAAENLITGSLTTRRLIFVHLTPWFARALTSRHKNSIQTTTLLPFF